MHTVLVQYCCACMLGSVFMIIITSSLVEVANAEDIVCLSGSEQDGNVCQGLVGDIAIIPCGPDIDWELEDNTTHTYYNDTSNTVLLEDTLDYLRLNLTAFMDKTVIRCVTAPDNGLQSLFIYTYTLSVLYPPIIINGIDNPILIRDHAYSIACPIMANPEPICSWEAVHCFDPSIVLNMTEHSLSPKNCNVLIEKVTLELKNIVCLTCNATNDLGSNSYIYNSLDIPACPSSPFILITSEADSQDSQLTVEKGSNLTLTCSGFGYEDFGLMIWCINQYLNGSEEGCHSVPSTYDKTLCRRTGNLVLVDVNETNTGSYRCYLSQDKYREIEVVVYGNNELNQDLEILNNSPKLSTKQMVCIVIAGLSVLLIIVMVSMVTTIYIRRCNKKSKLFKFAKLSTWGELSDDDDYEFDVFISFVEEDKHLAEEIIKKPLEDSGYSICWHHDAFIPGYTINENMECFIFRSKYTIVLISKAFFASSFCEYELEVVRRKVQKTNHNCLIPVMVEADSSEVPSELLKITHININDKSLIGRLQQILGDPGGSKHHAAAGSENV